MADCIVVGGGIIGMLTARELVERGASVVLLERGHTGREASWAGGGILSPLYPWRYDAALTQLAGWSQRQYPRLCQELLDETGVDPEWLPSGLLVLDMDEHDRAVAWAGEHGAALDVLSGVRLHDSEPALHHTWEHAIWMSMVAQVRNPRLMRALRASLEARGVTIHEETEARGLLRRGGRVSGVETAAGAVEGDHTLVAGGAWSAGLLEDVGPPLALRPVRGQMLLLRLEGGGPQRIILHNNRYLIPRKDGRVLVGSTVEEAGFDKSTTADARADLLAAAGELVPALGGVEVEAQWAGLRPGSPGDRPWIGPHPELEGLFVSTGHFRNGMVLAPGSARLMGEIVAGEIPFMDVGPYRLDREEETSAGG